MLCVCDVASIRPIPSASMIRITRKPRVRVPIMKKAVPKPLRPRLYITNKIVAMKQLACGVGLPFPCVNNGTSTWREPKHSENVSLIVVEDVHRSRASPHTGYAYRRVTLSANSSMFEFRHHSIMQRLGP